MEQEYRVVEIDDSNLKEFIDFPYQIYDRESPWVPPLKREYKKYITGEGSAIYSVGPSAKLMVYKGDTLVGRMIVGMNQDLNEAKGHQEAYLSEFECFNDQKAADALFAAGEQWAIAHGADTMKGPFALPGGDDNRGFLYENFTDPTYVMNIYNPKYYNDLIVNAGYEKYLDVYGFLGDMKDADALRYQKLVPIAMKRFGFTLENIRLDKIDDELMDIKTVIEQSMPDTWEDLIPPSAEEYESIKGALVPLADEELIYIARDLDGNPIGFNVTMPDYNQVMKKMYGKMDPISLLKFLYYKNKIDRARLFVLFVIPEYQNKGVTAAIYLRSYITAIKKGYKTMEGSTIWEYNKEMLRDIEAIGVDRYKTWRIYIKPLQ